MGLLKAELKNNAELLSSNATTAISKAVERLLAPTPIYINELERKIIDSTTTENVNVLVFYYTKERLMSEAHKRTSYIGRVRKDDDKNSLMEQVTLTIDDDDLSESFLREAQGYVFEKLQNYTHGLDDCCLYEDVTYKEDGVEKTESVYMFKILEMEWFNKNALMMLDTAIHETMVAFLMFKWFLGALPNEAQFYYEEFERQLKNITQRVNTQKQPVNRKYHLF